ncbi:PREDICTED: DNA [Prunus dulcis]|uniref:PREDICTED: DNA n=1 Tax=Prunus dulcis TaxID=3755 RepID=A0A5E4GEB7_PRUDU|nr:PREDICTED: DNA [Prunus dulcis]
MRLKEGDKMASADIIPAAMRNATSLKGPWLLFVSESGYGKRAPLSTFHSSKLNRVGLIIYKVMFGTRGSCKPKWGLILMRLDHAGKIQSASLISAPDEEPEVEVEAAALG